MPIDDETARRKVRRFKLTPEQLCTAGHAPSGEIIQATTDDDGNFVFTLRSESFSPIPDGEPISFLDQSEQTREIKQAIHTVGSFIDNAKRQALDIYERTLRTIAKLPPSETIKALMMAREALNA